MIRRAQAETSASLCSLWFSSACRISGRACDSPGVHSFRVLAQHLAGHLAEGVSVKATACKCLDQLGVF